MPKIGYKYIFDTYALCMKYNLVTDMTASIAQWLEHWSCKPGVVSSILTGGLPFSLQIKLQLHNTSNTCITQCNFIKMSSTFQVPEHTVCRLFY